MSHYVEMARRVASRLSQYPNVIGYDLMNEPYSNGATLNLHSRGIFRWQGLEDLSCQSRCLHGIRQAPDGLPIDLSGIGDGHAEITSELPEAKSDASRLTRQM